MYIRSLRYPLSVLPLVGSTSPYGIGSHTAIRAMFRLARALKPNELKVKAKMGGERRKGDLKAQPHVGCSLWGVNVVGVRY